ncbi:MAG: hypothetical protein C0170_00555 [Hydrogenobaculum sp.]|nr:MAG: hypothetical protein C0170_00555 [Hydrogenobaculum sp.]
MMKSYIQTTKAYLFLIFMSVLVGVGLSRAEQVYVKPGNFSYFDAYIPTYITAGQKVTFTLRPMDAYGNFIKDFTYYDKKFLVRSTGELSVDPALFSSKDFKDGSFSITIEDNKAGTATLSILEGSYPVLIKNEATGSMMPVVSIKVVNGPVYKFAIEAPSTVEAGRDFVAKIIALDKYGNIVRNYASIGSDVVVELKTSNGTLPYTVHAYKFKNGIADIILRYDIPSKVAIDAYEVNNRKISSQDYYVDLYPPKPSKFRVEIPESSISAGEPFEVYITAYDQDGQVIRNYNIVGKTVHLVASGTGKLIPNVVPPEDFINGTAKVNLIYTKSEPITISAYIEGMAPKKPAQSVQKEVTKLQPTNIAKPKKKEQTKPQKNVYKEVASLEFPKAYGSIRKYDYHTKFVDGRRIGIIDVFFTKRIKHPIARTVKPVYFGNEALGKLIVQNGKDTVVIVLVPEKEDLYVTDIKRHDNSMDITIERARP